MLPHDQDRAWRVAENHFSDAPQEVSIPRAQPSGADDDQIRLALLR
jgi:hypothetical protein